MAGRILSSGWRPGASSANVIEPATGKVISSIGIADEVQISKAAAIARDAQQPWADYPLENKARVFRTAAHLIEQHLDELAR